MPLSLSGRAGEWLIMASSCRTWAGVRCSRSSKPTFAPCCEVTLRQRLFFAFHSPLHCRISVPIPPGCDPHCSQSASGVAIGPTLVCTAYHRSIDQKLLQENLTLHQAPPPVKSFSSIDHPRIAHETREANRSASRLRAWQRISQALRWPLRAAMWREVSPSGPFRRSW